MDINISTDTMNNIGTITRHVLTDGPNPKKYLDDYAVIITDRNLKRDDWTLEDVVMVDDIYHTASDNANTIEALLSNLTPTPSDNQVSLPFKNRSKIMVVEQNRAKYLMKGIKSDILIPRYMYLTRPIVDIPGRQKYLPDNLTFHEKIELPISSFGLTSDINNVISIFIIRLIFNYVVRDFRADDIVEMVYAQLEDFVDGLDMNITSLIDIMDMSPSAVYEACMLLITKYDMLNTTILSDGMLLVQMA